jgi:DNA mismatch endonuclease, patch repair protein
VSGPSDLITDPQTSVRLGRIRQRDTRPEQMVRSLLTALGIRYRIRNRDLPGSPDVANRRRKWAVFVHGCFWHAHQGCGRATTPKRNNSFWVAKFEANRRRDERAFAALTDANYKVLVIWECETTDVDGLRRRLESFVLSYRSADAMSVLSRSKRGRRLTLEPSRPRRALSASPIRQVH